MFFGQLRNQRRAETVRKTGRRMFPDRNQVLLDGLTRKAADVGACNAEIVQFTVGQAGQLVIGLTEAFPVIVFAYNSIDHCLGLSLSHGHGTADRRLARSSLTMDI